MIKEAEAKSQFDVQIGRIQDAIAKLDGIVTKMVDLGPAGKPTTTQRMALRYAAEDIDKLHKKAQ